jgi:hypothetical protein
LVQLALKERLGQQAGEEKPALLGLVEKPVRQASQARPAPKGKRALLAKKVKWGRRGLRDQKALRAQLDHPDQ